MNSDPKAKLEFKRFEGYEIMILYPISMKQFTDQLFLGLKMGKLWQKYKLILFLAEILIVLKLASR